jgi:excisionase family DNA binding protein
MEFSEWLTASQAARSLGISVEYIRVLLRTGRLSYVQTPLGKLISPESIEDARSKHIGQMRRRV